MKKTAYCKINLTLEILGTKRADGFHDIKSIMHKIPLGDRLCIEIDKNSEGVFLECDSDVCPNEDNLAYRAAKAYLDIYSKNTKKTARVHIKLFKVTPTGAGLGGGSADAACILDTLHSTLSGIDDGEFLSLASTLGSDVVFCLERYTCAICSGRGEICREISHLPPHISICIAKPYESLNTKGIYSAYDEKFGDDYTKDNSDKMEKALKTGKLNEIKKLICNDFEQICIPRLEVIEEIKQSFLKNGAVFSQMSGSGSAVFGIFEDDGLCLKCKDILTERSDCEVFAFTGADFEKMYKGE
jgi:4-diphosphocytidyl-2-C-methyl-D-erythritol kinase